MLILNFTRPLTEEHKTQIEALAGIAIDDIRMVPVQIDQVQPLEAQIRALVDAVQLTSEEWQTRPFEEWAMETLTSSARPEVARGGVAEEEIHRRIKRRMEDDGEHHLFPAETTLMHTELQKRFSRSGA